jgi:5-methylcytosine-specific restriction endonuclease McrA
MNVLEIKRAVRERDGNCCTQCGVDNADHLELHGKSLHVHRLIPGSEYSVEGCVTLCIDCHGPQPKSEYGSRNVIKIRPALFAQLRALADYNCTTAAQEANRLLREALEKLGYWPPPSSPPTP